MNRSSLFVTGAAVLLAVASLTGCQKPPDKPWTIVVQNQSGSWCEVEVDVRPGLSANAPSIAPFERRTLRAGTGNLVVGAVSVSCNRKKQVITPEVTVPAGKSFLIDIDGDGRLKVSLTETGIKR